MIGKKAAGCLLCLVLMSCHAAARAGRFEPFTLQNHTIIQYGIYQDAVSEEGDTLSNRLRAADIVDLVFDYRLSARDRFRSLLRWARGNGLNNTGGLTLAPYGGDLEDDVRNINGHDRDYLLEAWYRHAFSFNGDTSAAVSAGWLDASTYIDTNAFAGDELTQFMNTAFVLNRLAGIPAYDPGVVLELGAGAWSLNTLVMRTRDSEAGDYTYAAAELSYHTSLAIGEGNYRVFGFSTSDDFRDPNKGKNKPLRGGGISLDQYLDRWLGLFVRIGYQNHVAPDYEHLYSGGIVIDGDLWQRPAQSAGIGLARLEGEDHSALTHTMVLEAWWRAVVLEFLDVTLDVQYMQDGRAAPEQDPSAVILGTRVNLSF